MPVIRPAFYGWCLAFGVSQTISTLALSKALKLSEISLVTALWKVSLLVLSSYVEAVKQVEILAA